MKINVISSKDIINIVRVTLDYADERLMGHGRRVAYIVERLLMQESVRSSHEMVLYALLGLLHDVGAFKTEEVDNLLKFESQNIWDHSVYGYLFLKSLSPLSELSQGVLYHHLEYKEYFRAGISSSTAYCAGILHIADRADLIMQKMGAQGAIDYIKANSGIRFTPSWVKIFLEAEEEGHFLEAIEDGSYEEELDRLMREAVFSNEEKDQILTMVAYSIDFRSEFMVLHTVTTVSVADAIAKCLNLNELSCEEIHYGALLHDIGKISTPVEILDKPGKLTDSEMQIMRRHVNISGEILGEFVAPRIKKMAVRHHEKIDGSGYPDGLTGADLSAGERIVAIADIISALTRSRSYKKAFGQEETCEILNELKKTNKICPIITDIVINNFPKIMQISAENGREVLEMYASLRTDYNRIISEIS